MIQKKEGEKKKKNLLSSGESYCRPSPSPARLRQPIDTVIQRKGRRKKERKEACNPVENHAINRSSQRY